jgi:hypothetical protein
MSCEEQNKGWPIYLRPAELKNGPHTVYWGNGGEKKHFKDRSQQSRQIDSRIIK